MTTLSAKLIFLIPDAHSLKDKRQIRRSLIDRARHKFNVSVAEVDTQDVHQTLTIGIAVVAGEFAHGQKMLDEAIAYLEENAGAAELLSIEMQ